MSRALDHAHMGGLFAERGKPHWRHEGTRCPACGQGSLSVHLPSDPCERPDPADGECDACGAEAGGLCMMTALGYAMCSACDVPQQVFPDDVIAGVRHA